MKLELSVRNVAATVVNLYAYDKRIKRDVKKLVREYGELTKELTQFFCAVDTGFMRDHVVTLYTPSGLGWETGWDVMDFVEAGLPFYPFWVEFGTELMVAQPALTPAYRETEAEFRAALRERVRRAVSSLG